MNEILKNGISKYVLFKIYVFEYSYNSLLLISRHKCNIMSFLKQ